MPEPHYAGVRRTGTSAVDDHFFRRYRALLDAEDAAFDELEHAYEDGDRTAFEVDLAVVALRDRAGGESFLEAHGLTRRTPLLL